MTELSQAERMVMEGERTFLVRGGQPITFEKGFIAARDYGRERERALEEALKNVERNDKTVYEYSGPDALNRDGLPNPLPGARWTTPREIARATLGPEAQPDHGPGEPSAEHQTVCMEPFRFECSCGGRWSTASDLELHLRTMRRSRVGESNG